MPGALVFQIVCARLSRALGCGVKPEPFWRNRCTPASPLALPLLVAALGLLNVPTVFICRARIASAPASHQSGPHMAIGRMSAGVRPPAGRAACCAFTQPPCMPAPVHHTYLNAAPARTRAPPAQCSRRSRSRARCLRARSASPPRDARPACALHARASRARVEARAIICDGKLSGACRERRLAVRGDGAPEATRSWQAALSSAPSASSVR
jgi:hypothetical protein